MVKPECNIKIVRESSYNVCCLDVIWTCATYELIHIIVLVLAKLANLQKFE